MKGNARKYDWSYFEVDSINDANNKLVNLNCSCIKEINILGHANEGFQNLVGRRDPRRGQPGYGRLQAKLSKETGKGEYGGPQLFKGLKGKFCKPCKIILRGCSAGSGEAGQKLLDAIAAVTGCETQAWDCPTTELTPYLGLPESGFLGFFAKPNVTAPAPKAR